MILHMKNNFFGRKFILLFSIPIFLLVIYGICQLQAYISSSAIHFAPRSIYSIEEVGAYVGGKNSTCDNKESQREKNMCRDEAAKDILSRFSFKEVLAGFEIAKGDCHNIMHPIAADYTQKQGDLAQVFSQCTPVCFGACYHGSVVGYMRDSGFLGEEPGVVREMIGGVCEALRGKETDSIYSQCLHGLGHAFMFTTNMDLLRSLELCDVLSSGAITCYEGVFMENFPLSATSPHPSRYIKEDDPIYPCNILEDRYTQKCYRFLTSHLYYLSGEDWEKTASLCRLVPLPYRNLCYQTVGSSGAGNYQEVKNMPEVCSFVPSGEPRDSCIRGIVEFFSDRFGGYKEKMFGMFDVCEVVDGEYKKTCYLQIHANITGWIPNRDEQIRACSRVQEPQYREWCMNGGEGHP